MALSMQPIAYHVDQAQSQAPSPYTCVQSLPSTIYEFVPVTGHLGLLIALCGSLHAAYSILLTRHSLLHSVRVYIRSGPLSTYAAAGDSQCWRTPLCIQDQHRRTSTHSQQCGGSREPLVLAGQRAPEEIRQRVEDVLGAGVVPARVLLREANVTVGIEQENTRNRSHNKCILRHQFL